MTVVNPAPTLSYSASSAAPAMPQEPPAQDFEIKALTTAMTRGDEDAYRQFYQFYFDRLLRYLLVVTGGQEDAAREALQATLLRVVRYIKRFESQDAFWSWLTVLAKSSLVDEQRKANRYRNLLARFFQPTSPAPPQRTQTTELDLLRLLESNLEALDPDDRNILERKYFDKEPVRSIAASLQSSEKAIDSRLVRIRRKLRELILKALEHEERI